MRYVSTLTLFKPLQIRMWGKINVIIKTILSTNCTKTTYLNLVLLSSLSSSSLRYQQISGLGEATSWHSKMSLLPSSSCLSWGFCVKLGAKSSDTPIVLAGHHGIGQILVVGTWRGVLFDLVYKRIALERGKVQQNIWLFRKVRCFAKALLRTLKSNFAFILSRNFALQHAFHKL